MLTEFPSLRQLSYEALNWEIAQPTFLTRGLGKVDAHFLTKLYFDHFTASDFAEFKLAKIEIVLDETDHYLRRQLTSRGLNLLKRRFKTIQQLLQALNTEIFAATEREQVRASLLLLFKGILLAAALLHLKLPCNQDRPPVCLKHLKSGQYLSEMRARNLDGAVIAHFTAIAAGVPQLANHNPANCILREMLSLQKKGTSSPTFSQRAQCRPPFRV